MRNDRVALTHADNPGLFVKITDIVRGEWTYVEEPLADEFTFSTELAATNALARLFRTRSPRYIVARKVVAF